MRDGGYTEKDTQAAILATSPNIAERHPNTAKYLKDKTAGLEFPPDEEKTQSWYEKPAAEAVKESEREIEM
jgi:hypothetical protein